MIDAQTEAPEAFALRNSAGVCPFCGERDFDAWGLKLHLMMWCAPYAEVQPEARQ